MSNHRSVMKFKKFNGEVIDDIGKYVSEKIKQEPTSTISVGCDSRQLRDKTLYVVSIVIYSQVVKHGAHVVFSRFKVPKIYDNFRRLWKECEYISEIADPIHEQLSSIHYHKPIKDDYYKLVDVHLDLNPEDKYLSNKVYKPAIHWFQGMGYKTYAKPESYASSSASDLLCR